MSGLRFFLFFLFQIDFLYADHGVLIDLVSPPVVSSGSSLTPGGRSWLWTGRQGPQQQLILRAPDRDHHAIAQVQRDRIRSSLWSRAVGPNCLLDGGNLCLLQSGGEASVAVS